MFWDCGSTLSLITEKKAESMKLKGKEVELEMTVVRGQTSRLKSKIYSIALVDLQGRKMEAQVLAIDTISSKIAPVDCKRIAKMFGVETINRPIKGEVDVLIGLQQFAYHPVKIKEIGHLLLMENQFGMVVAGSHTEGSGTQIQESCSMIKHATIMHIQESMNRFYGSESIGTTCQPRCGRCGCGKCHPGGKDMTLKDEEELEQIETGVSFDQEKGRWVAKYPWVRNPDELPDNRKLAIQMMMSTEKRLDRNSSKSEVFHRQMDELVERGVARSVSKEEILKYEGPKYYINYHGVMNPSSSSTPFRIVFNSSAKYCGSSLNEFLAKGPSLLNSLFGILLRWRQKQYGFVGDISKMFHSIEIPYADQMTHLYFWRSGNKEKTLEESLYAITKVNMGDRPSACIAQVCLRKAAEAYQEEYPEAGDIIKRSSYMDDIATSTSSREEGEARMKEIDKVLLANGFKIKGWIKSGEERPEAKSNLMQSKVRLLSGAEEQTEEVESVLGMLWEPKEDTIGYRSKVIEEERATKRSILSATNTIFDPLGLVAPVTVNAKIILRQIWAESPKGGWDEEIPCKIKKEWDKLKVELAVIDQMVIPRALTPEMPKKPPMLVIFSDGSNLAYGAVAYMRWEVAEGFVCRIVSAKSRVAPIKIIDIVRLELCGAVLGVRLRNSITKEIGFKFERIMHLVDSEIVHAMVHKDSYGFGTFAANRIGEIQRTAEPEEWGWVEGKLNVADAITRGSKVKELCGTSTWLDGPEFMRRELDEWPVRWEVRRTVKLPELKRNKELVAKTSGIIKDTLEARIQAERFSSWRRLVFTTARILQLYKRYKSQQKSRELEPETLEEAKILWFKDAQKKIQISEHVKLRPRVQDGMIMVGSRTERWMAGTWNKQEFILLPKEGHISEIIAREVHENGGHLGEAATVAKIRARYWILGVRKLVKEIIRRCVKCKVKLKRLEGQQMSTLPIERIKPCPAFTNIGVDYFGPFRVKGEVQKRVTGKCFGVLFTCLVSRAVHLDIAGDYSTDEFLHTLRRFASIRGWPRKIISDRGTNLVGASNELKEMMKKVDWGKVEKQSLINESEWSFSPADAPWYNGATEALVKATKRALNAAIGENTMRFSELQTVMLEAAQLVNQRPIGDCPKSPDEQTYLCPNDLLLGRASPRTPQIQFETVTSSYRRFNFTQSVITTFWRRWIREAFPNLVIEHKWHVERRNLRPGDVVLIQDANAVRGHWRKALVERAIPSEDGKIRRATLSYRNDQETRVEVERAAQRLIVLVPKDEKQNNEGAVY